MNSLSLVLLVSGLVVACAIAVYLLRYRRFSGARLVDCPENEKPAGVRVAARRAAIPNIIGSRGLRLEDCTRWPQRQACDQECLAQIENADDGCLVREHVREWLKGRCCALCSAPLGELSAWDHRPALMDSERRTLQWHEIAVDRLDEILSTHHLVCWDCHVVETVYRRHPDLPVERSHKWKNEKAAGS